MQVLIAALLLQAAAPATSEPAAPALGTIAGAIRAGRLEEAATLLTLRHVALPFEPDPQELALLEGELAVERGRVADAERRVAAIAESEAVHCRLARIRGLALAEREDADAAIDMLGDVADYCVADWRVWAELGRLLAGRREESASRFAFDNALRLAAGHVPLRLAFARMLIGFADLDGADEQIRQARTLASGDGEVRALADYLTGMRGLEPQRAGENDEVWAQRLADAAEGARVTRNEPLARALFGRALLLSPRYDARLLSEASQP